MISLGLTFYYRWLNPYKGSTVLEVIEGDSEEDYSWNFYHQYISGIIDGSITNTKTVSGTLSINTQDPKDNISVTVDDTQIISIGAGGINTNVLTANAICCTNENTSAIQGVIIDGLGYGINIISDGDSVVTIDSSGVNTSSDRRKKDNIIKLDDTYSNLLNEIHSVSFNYKKEENKHFGFIAQDVEKAFISNNLKNYVTSIDANGFYKLNYCEMIPILWKILQEQKEKIEELEEKING